MPATDYGNQIMLEAAVNKTLPPYANVYTGFTTGNPGTAGSFSTEVSGPGYQRIPMTFGGYVPPLTNTSEALWTPTGGWSAIGYAFLADSSQGGNMLYYDDVDSVTPGLGHILKIPIGNFTIT
jgi:hypothetical protein